MPHTPAHLAWIAIPNPVPCLHCPLRFTMTTVGVHVFGITFDPHSHVIDSVACSCLTHTSCDVMYSVACFTPINSHADDEAQFVQDLFSDGDLHRLKRNGKAVAQRMRQQTTETQLHDKTVEAPRTVHMGLTNLTLTGDC